MTLYKYAPASLGIRILDGLRLKVTPPNELNDPFELTPRSRNHLPHRYFTTKLRHDPEHFRPAYDEMVAAEGPTATFEEFLQAIRNYHHRMRPRIRQLYAKALVQTDLQSTQFASKHMVILCLSAAPASIPMWSHYADHHKGVVLGLDPGAECFQLDQPLAKVRYSRRRATVSPLTSDRQSLQAHLEKVLLTKSRHWAYEKEYRFCHSKHRAIPGTDDEGNPIYFIPIWPSAVTKVILGCCIKPSNELKLRQTLADRRFKHVRVLRAVRHPKQFRLQILRA